MSVITVKYTDQNGDQHVIVKDSEEIEPLRQALLEVRRRRRGDVPLELRPGYNDHYYLTDGILSIHGEHVGYVLEAVRLGLSMVDWLYGPVWFGEQFIAAKNRAAGIELCKECDGTGNWLESMYQQCQACKGTGGVGGTGLRKSKGGSDD